MVPLFIRWVWPRFPSFLSFPDLEIGLAMTPLFAEIILYLVLGLLAAFINIPVIFIIARSPQLRVQKEFVIIAGLSLSDAINGLGFFLTGVYRMNVVHGGEDALASRFDCLTTVSQSLNVAVDQASGWMLLAVTLDRLHAVFRPIKYFKLTHLYAWTVLGVVVLLSLGCLLLAYISTRNHTFPEVSVLCYTKDSVDRVLYGGLEVTRIVVVTCSILLYVPICVRLYTIAKQRQLGSYSNRRYQQLKNMTLTVAFSSALAVIFVLIPDGLIAFQFFGLQRYGTYLFPLILAKSTINVVIYVLRNPVVKSEMKKIVRCSQNPSVTHVSNVHNAMIPSARRAAASPSTRRVSRSNPTSTAAANIS